MPRNVYHEINLHLVGRTKVNAPVLVDAVERRCHQYLKIVSNESISLMRRGLKVRDKPVETGSGVVGKPMPVVPAVKRPA